MLGVVRNPELTPADEVMRSVAEDLGVGETFTLAPVGVFFDEPDRQVPDLFFGGAGRGLPAGGPGAATLPHRSGLGTGRPAAAAGPDHIRPG